MKKSIFCSLIISLLISSYGLEAAGKKKKPQNIPDLTKGEKWEKPKSKGGNGQFGRFMLGPTGLMSFMIGGEKGSQILIDMILPNSPATGKFKVGDIILGVNGKRFKQGENMCEAIGAAINESDKEKNKGKISFMIWRDKNWIIRNGAVDMSKVDVDDLFKEIDDDSTGEVTEWMDKDQKDKSFDNMQNSKAPIEATELTVDLNLKALGSFSDTAPYNCKKSEKLLEGALEAVRRSVKKKLSFGRHYLGGHALLASGTPEDLELVKKAVHKSKAFKPDRFISTWGYGMGSWRCGYAMVFGAEYYFRTGDKYILPALREIATKTAMGQTYGGSWSHSFSARSFNMGKINMRASGYGAMNQAGGPCFLGLVMCKKAGITNEHIEKAIAKSCKFYGAISEIGATPYGMHGTANYADSNGKNGPPAYAFKLLGKVTDAQYFARCEAVASVWGHGGHCGGSWGAIWRTLGACLNGPEAVKYYHKDRQNWYALARRHDGGFVVHYPSGGPTFHDDPNALYALRFMGNKGTTYLTGKEPMKELQLTPEGMQDIIDGNGGEKHIAEWSNEEIYGKCHTFYPKMRDIYAKELGKRYKEGKADGAVDKALEFLKDKEPRKRAAGVLILGECGLEEVKKNLNPMIALLDDPRQFVRINAVRALKPHFQALESDLAEPLMRLVTRQEYWEMINDNNNVPTYVFNALYPRQPKRGPKLFQTEFAARPFDYGLDPHLTRETLERAFQWDPGRSQVLKMVAKWDRPQIMEFAGPIVFGAENLQMNDMMFAGGALSAGRALLNKFDMKRELSEAACYDLFLLDNLPRAFYPRAKGHDRAMGGRTPYDPQIVFNAKGEARYLLPSLKKYLITHPLASISFNVSKGRVKKMVDFDLYDTIVAIENDKEAEVPESIFPKVDKSFDKELAAKSDDKAKIAYCRLLLNPERKTYYRQMSAMKALVKILGPKACADLVPYLNHDHWRWREHSRKLVKEMGSCATPELIALFEKNNDDFQAAGIMAALTLVGGSDAVGTALKALKERGERTQAEAALAVVTGSRFKHLDKIIDKLRDSESDRALDGFEKALLMCKGNKTEEELISKTLISNLKKSKKYARRTIYYVLAMIGGKENLDLLKRVTSTKSEGDFENVVQSVSYSRDPGATKWLEKLVTELQGTKRSFVVAEAGARRMVLGDDTEEIGHCDPKKTTEFARQVLKSVRNTKVIKALSYYPSVESADLMLKYMRKGPKEVTVAASKGIIDCARRMSIEEPLEERKGVAEVLRNVIEYLTVTKLNMPEEQRGDKDSGYYEAVKKVDKAGKAMLRIYDPDEADIEDIDDDDLDI